MSGGFAFVSVTADYKPQFVTNYIVEKSTKM